MFIETQMPQFEVYIQMHPTVHTDNYCRASLCVCVCMFDQDAKARQETCVT